MGGIRIALATPEFILNVHLYTLRPAAFYFILHPSSFILFLLASRPSSLILFPIFIDDVLKNELFGEGFVKLVVDLAVLFDEIH